MCKRNITCIGYSWITDIVCGEFFAGYLSTMINNNTTCKKYARTM